MKFFLVCLLLCAALWLGYRWGQFKAETTLPPEMGQDWNKYLQDRADAASKAGACVRNSLNDYSKCNVAP